MQLIVVIMGLFEGCMTECKIVNKSDFVMENDHGNFCQHVCAYLKQSVNRTNYSQIQQF